MDRSRVREIMTLALPILGGMVSQNILNLIDTAMVGHLGDEALAAVGIGGFVTFMSTAFITGLATGVQAIVSRRKGEGKTDCMAIPLNGGLVLATAAALPLTGLLYFLVPYFFPFLVEDAAVVTVGVPYLQVRMFGILATGVNFTFRGYWNGVNLSKLYMRTLVVMHITNAILNYVLIFGKFGFPELGATGAAVGTVASLCVGSVYYMYLGWKHARQAGFLAGIPEVGVLKTMIRVSLPTSIQNFFFASGLTLFFWIVGQIGTSELAASQVLVNLLLVAILPGMGFGLASATLVGQSLGRKQPDEAKQWGYDVGKIAVLFILVLSIPALIAPELLLGIFLKEPETLEMARWPLRFIAATIAFDVWGGVMMNSLLGAGDSRRVMLVSILMQWAVNLPLAYVFGPLLGYGLLAIWGVQALYRVVQAGILTVFWAREKWTLITL